MKSFATPSADGQDEFTKVMAEVAETNSKLSRIYLTQVDQPAQSVMTFEEEQFLYSGVQVDPSDIKDRCICFGATFFYQPFLSRATEGGLAFNFSRPLCRAGRPEHDSFWEAEAQKIQSEGRTRFKSLRKGTLLEKTRLGLGIFDSLKKPVVVVHSKIDEKASQVIGQGTESEALTMQQTEELNEERRRKYSAGSWDWYYLPVA